MKRRYVLLVLMFMLTGSFCRAQVSYLENIKVVRHDVDMQRRVVTVDMLLDLQEMKIKTQHTVTLTPVLVSADGSRELALSPVVIDGGVRHKVFLRENLLTKEDAREGAYTVIRRQNGKAQQVEYRKELPYERWMLNGRLELREEVCGCADCEEGKNEETLLTPVIPAYVPTYVTNWLQPAEEHLKTRAETRSARLQFPQDNYWIMPGYKDNQKELDAVKSSIQAVKENTDLTITGIYITGYASPEATVGYNKRLAKNRALAFTTYLQKEYKELPKELWHTDWVGEDWKGLVAELEAMKDLENRDKVLEIARNPGDDLDAAEERIKALLSETFYKRQLLAGIYTQLRRNDYRVEYNVRHFDVKDARELVFKRPDLLSLSEIYSVAESYGKGTKEYNEILMIAARTYPDKVEAVHNAARELVNAGKYAEAIELVKTCKAEDASLYNVLGVACAGAGKYSEARDAFAKAMAAGSADAERNARELECVMEQL